MPTNEPYQIGERIWHRGDEVEIETGPYWRHGAEWQDGRRIADGFTITVLTPRARERHQAEKQASWSRQQAEFRRLRKLAGE